MLAHIILFLLSSLILAKSSVFLVKEISKISKLLGLSSFTVGFIVMSFATSLPETFVGISSALKGQSALSFGNVIGSIILNTTLIIGIGAVISKGIKIDRTVAQKDISFMNFAATLPIIMLWDRVISRIEGGLLLFIFFYHIYRASLEKRDDDNKYDGEEVKNIVTHGVRFLVGCAFLIGSSEVLVKNAFGLAVDLSIPLVLVGLFALAIGTSLPELSFQITTVLKKRPGIGFGNILGSVITNSLFVLGLTSVISPIVLTQTTIFVVSSFFLIGALGIFTTFLRSDRKLSLDEGLGLILLYLVFVVLEFSLERV